MDQRRHGLRRMLRPRRWLDERRRPPSSFRRPGDFHQFRHPARFSQQAGGGLPAKSGRQLRGDPRRFVEHDHDRRNAAVAAGRRGDRSGKVQQDELRRLGAGRRGHFVFHVRRRFPHHNPAGSTMVSPNRRAATIPAATISASPTAPHDSSTRTSIPTCFALGGMADGIVAQVPE